MHAAVSADQYRVMPVHDTLPPYSVRDERHFLELLDTLR